MLEAILAKKPEDSKTYVEDVFSTYLYTGNGTTNIINTGFQLNETATWSTYTLSEGDSPTFAGIHVDSSNNFYVTGATTPSSLSVPITAKYNSSGVLQWQRKFSGAADGIRLRSVKVDSSGNVYVVGTTNASNIDRGLLLKYNSSGVLQWQRRFYSGNSFFCDLVIDSAGAVYVTGNVKDAGNTETYISVVKYDSSGTLQWQNRILEGSTIGNEAPIGNSIAVDSANNIYITGKIRSGGSTTIWIVVKYNSSGTLQWQRKLTTASNATEGKRIAIDSSDNVYVSGFDAVSNLYLVKYNSSGTLQWQRTIENGTNATSVSQDFGTCIDASGNIYVTAGANPGLIAKYNSSGVLQWSKYLRKTNYNFLLAAVADTLGNLYVATNSLNITAGIGTLAVVKLAQDNSTKSGSAFYFLAETSLTDTAGALTSATGTSTSSTSSYTSEATTYTDAAGTATAQTYTQNATTLPATKALVWIKRRNTTGSNNLIDNVRGVGKYLTTNSTNPSYDDYNAISNFEPNGFQLFTNSDVNANGGTYASWTFCKAAKFFDCVTWTGNGANRTISHALGVVPGLIIVKRTDTTGDWQVYHRSLANTEYLVLNSTAAKATGTTRWNSTTPTATEFSLGTNATVNASGGTYVAYLFAHDTTADGIVQCGSFTTDGSGNATVNLGWEPQYIVTKKISSSGLWFFQDVMRGIFADRTGQVFYQDASQEDPITLLAPTATGFSYGSVGATSSDLIYLAIRRGPMRKPTDATKVFKPSLRTGTGAAATITGIGFAPDTTIITDRTSGNYGPVYYDRLRGPLRRLRFGTLEEEITETDTLLSFEMDGYKLGADGGWFVNRSATNIVDYNFKRAPSFFDCLCYSGTGSARTVTHNLGAIPEFMVVKRRDSNMSYTADSVVYAGSPSEYLVLNTAAAKVTSNTDRWNNTAPTATTFSLGTNGFVNASGGTYVAYLFATCAGVSKVGSYTGNGSSLNIDCGFTNGARFVLIKRTNASGDWYVWDTARGIVSANDPHLSLNSTAAEVTTNDSIDPLSTGFTINQIAATNINVNAASYIYLAIA